MKKLNSFLFPVLLVTSSQLNFVISAKNNCFEDDVNYTGTDMNDGMTQKTETAEKCQTLCCNIMGCKGFTWFSGDFFGKINYPIFESLKKNSRVINGFNYR